MIRRVPSKQRNASINRERDPGVLKRLAMLLLCGLILAGGFVYAGKQHFAALKLGYQTESLRRVRDQLIEDQRRFLLEREAAANPARLEAAARRLGLQPLQPAQVDPLGREARNLTEKISPAPENAAGSSNRDTQKKPARKPR